MFKKYKQLIIGIVIGSILFGSMSVIAEQLYNVTINPFRIMVNGVEKPIEGYNIDGYSYFKLRDIGQQVGFNVDFKEDTILIGDTATPSPDEKFPRWEGENIYYDESGKKYHTWSYINKLCNTLKVTAKEPLPTPGDISTPYNMIAFKVVDGEQVILKENIPYILADNAICISEEYFLSELLPLDD